MARLLTNWRGGYQTDEQRKAMFARMRGGGGGGGRGSGTGGSGRSYNAQVAKHPSPYTGPTPAEAAAAMNAESAAFLDKHLWSRLRGEPEYLADGTPYFAGVVVGPGGIAKAGKMAPALKSFLRNLGVFGGSLGVGLAIGDYRDKNPTMDPRKEHWLALGQDLAYTIATLSGLKLARRGISAIPGTSRLGELLGVAGDKIKAAQAAVAGKTPGIIKTPLSWVAKAYNAVAGFTGAEIKQFSEMPGALKKYQLSQGLTGRAAEIRAQAGLISSLAHAQSEAAQGSALDLLSRAHALSRAGSRSAGDIYQIGARSFRAAVTGAEGSGRSAEQLLALAGKFETKAAGMQKEALGAIARAGYVAGGMSAVHTAEQAIKDKYRRQMESAFPEGKPFILNPDADITDTPLKRAAMFATGTLGNPVEKQTRFYVGGKYTKDLAERAYQEYQYDTIEAARKAGHITAKEADRLQVERAKQKPFNMAGKSIHSFTPAIAGFSKFAASTISKAIKYRDPSELKTIYNPQHAAGVGLMAYGSTVGGKLPSSIPISWNAFLAGQGVYQAYKQGPKNWRGKVFAPLQLESAP